VDADLGGDLIKQRVARKGQGRRGGYRVVVAIRSADFAVFLFGFAKGAQDNIDDRQLNVLAALPPRGFRRMPRQSSGLWNKGNS